MRIFKSLLGGLGASFLAMILLLAIGLALVHLYAKRLPPDQRGGIGWDPVSALTLPGLVLYLVIAFVAGFWLAFRH